METAGIAPRGKIVRLRTLKDNDVETRPRCGIGRTGADDSRPDNDDVRLAIGFFTLWGRPG
jgi:hypothetical protein